MATKLQLVLSTGIFCIATAFVESQAASLPKAAELVPAETVVLVDISDFNQLRTRFEKSTFYKLYKDPAMAAFVADFIGKFQDKMRNNENPVIRTIFDANGLPEGRVVFALTAGNTGEEEPLIVVISQWGRNTERIKEAVEKMAAKTVERGAHRAIEEYRDVNVITLKTEVSPRQVPDWERFKPEDGNVTMKTIQPPPEKTCYCFIDDCLIAGTDVETIKFVVAHIKGVSGSSLSGDPDYIAVMDAVRPYRDADLYVNLKQWLKTIAAEDKTGQTQKEMANLGIDSIAGLGCSLGFDAEGGNLFSGKAFLKTSGSKKGIPKMLDIHSEPVRAPRFIPASAYSVSFLNIDIKRAFDELVSIMSGMDPEFATSLQEPLVEAGAEGEPAVSLRPDVIEYLGSEIVIAQNVNKPFSVGARPTDNLIALSVSNRSALEKSLSLVHRRLIAPNNPESTRELLGHTRYLLGPSALPFLDGAMPMLGPVNPGSPRTDGETPGQRTMPPPARMAFTITDTHLIFGPESAVERAIRALGGADSESVGTTEWFAAAKSAAPSVVGLASFKDNAASSELLWWMLKDSDKGRRANAEIGPASLAPPEFLALADFKLLPEFNAVRKYFGCSTFYGISRADGFLFELKYLNPRSKDIDNR